MSERPVYETPAAYFANAVERELGIDLSPWQFNRLAEMFRDAMITAKAADNRGFYRIGKHLVHTQFKAIEES